VTVGAGPSWCCTADCALENALPTAIVEPDALKLPERIADARHAIIERIEATLAEPHAHEQQELNDALNGLQVIHQEYDRRLRLTVAGYS
jgi:hypothetical protein